MARERAPALRRQRRHVRWRPFAQCLRIAI
jgi:hypothetical protein